MKPSLLLSTAAVVLAASLPLPAQREPDSARSARPAVVASPDSTNTLEVAPPHAMDRGVRKYAGQTVYGANGEKLGTIKDFVIDKQTGRVVYAVVSTGGFLGAGETLRLVPLHALQTAPEGTPGFKLRIGRASWDRSPSLINEAFSAGIVSIGDEHHRAMTELFGTPTNANVPRVAPPLAQPARDRAAQLAASPWIRATLLRDQDIHAAGQEIGEIDDVIIDLQRGTASALVEPEDDVLGHEKPILVPLTELTLITFNGDKLATTLTRDDFARLDPNHRSRAESKLLPTGRDTPNAAIDSPTATLASAARSARQALDADPNLARADIRVTPENGMLILRGRVRTEQLKDQAESAVKQAASGIRLQNYLIIDPR